MELCYTFDPEKFFLGSLCKHGHVWPGTNLSLRRIDKRNHTSNCLGCTGRKKSNWLISFVDCQAMGFADGYSMGKPCPKNHLFQNMQMTLRYRSKCIECDKTRKKSHINKEYQRKYQREWYNKNREMLNMRDQIRNATPERRNYRRTHRRSRSKYGLSYTFCQRHGLPQSWSKQIAIWQSNGFSPIAVKDMIILHRYLQKFKPSFTVAQTVADSYRRYLNLLSPEERRLRNNKLQRRKYHHDPEYRFYHRQKSKRRKALMRGSVGVQLTGRQIRARFAEFGQCCAYCGGLGQLHIEHVIPISKGGTHVLGNVVPACERCNYSKQAHDVEAWLKSQAFFSDVRWRKIKRVLGWDRSPVGQLALL